MAVTWTPDLSSECALPPDAGTGPRRAGGAKSREGPAQGCSAL